MLRIRICMKKRKKNDPNLRNKPQWMVCSEHISSPGKIIYLYATQYMSYRYSLMSLWLFSLSSSRDKFNYLWESIYNYRLFLRKILLTSFLIIWVRRSIWICILYMATKNSDLCLNLYRCKNRLAYTVCPKSLDPFYLVTYYIKWAKTSLTYSIGNFKLNISLRNRFISWLFYIHT